MKITMHQFENELLKESRKINIAILGMSGSGKTHWSKILAHRYGYSHVEFDDLIGKSPELAGLIKDVEGENMAEKLGNYFGMPWSNGFEAKEKIYLSLERKFMSNDYPAGSILDLTGSCIYHPKEMEAIKTNGLVVYFETSLEMQKEMLKIFLANPKPVCWKGVFQKIGNETNEAALARCYPVLLAQRSKLYELFADVTIPYDLHRNIKGPNKFAQEIKKRLPLN